jgi:hypothetical protein
MGTSSAKVADAPCWSNLNPGTNHLLHGHQTGGAQEQIPDHTTNAATETRVRSETPSERETSSFQARQSPLKEHTPRPKGALERH